MLPLLVGRCRPNAQHVAGSPKPSKGARWALLGIMVLFPRTHLAAANTSTCEVSRSVLESYGVQVPSIAACGGPKTTPVEPARQQPGQPSCQLLEQSCALEGSGFHRELTCRVKVTCRGLKDAVEDHGDVVENHGGRAADGHCNRSKNLGNPERGAPRRLPGRAKCGDPAANCAGNCGGDLECCKLCREILSADSSGGGSSRGVEGDRLERANSDGGGSPGGVEGGEVERAQGYAVGEGCNECPAPIKPGAVGWDDRGSPHSPARGDKEMDAVAADRGWAAGLRRWLGGMGSFWGQPRATPDQATGAACAVCRMCRLAVLQPLTAGVYADPWELVRWERDWLRNPDRVHSFRVFGPIDVESMEALAAPTLLVAETSFDLMSLGTDSRLDSSASTAHQPRSSDGVSASCKERIDGHKLGNFQAEGRKVGEGRKGGDVRADGHNCGEDVHNFCHVRVDGANEQGVASDSPQELLTPSLCTNAGPEREAGLSLYPPRVLVEGTVRAPLHQRYPKPHAGHAREAGAGLSTWLAGAETTFHLPPPFVLLGCIQEGREGESGVTWGHVGPSAVGQPAPNKTLVSARTWVLLKEGERGPEVERGLDWQAAAGKLEHGLLVGPTTLLFQLACAFAALRAVCRKSQGPEVAAGCKLKAEPHGGKEPGLLQGENGDVVTEGHGIGGVERR